MRLSEPRYITPISADRERSYSPDPSDPGVQSSASLPSRSAARTQQGPVPGERSASVSQAAATPSASAASAKSASGGRQADWGNQIVSHLFQHRREYSGALGDRRKLTVLDNCHQAARHQAQAAVHLAYASVAVALLLASCLPYLYTTPYVAAGWILQALVWVATNLGRAVACLWTCTEHVVATMWSALGAFLYGCRRVIQTILGILLALPLIVTCTMVAIRSTGLGPEVAPVLVHAAHHTPLGLSFNLTRALQRPRHLGLSESAERVPPAVYVNVSSACPAPSKVEPRAVEPGLASMVAASVMTQLTESAAATSTALGRLRSAPQTLSSWVGGRVLGRKAPATSGPSWYASALSLLDLTQVIPTDGIRLP